MDLIETRGVHQDWIPTERNKKKEAMQAGGVYFCTGLSVKSDIKLAE